MEHFPMEMFRIPEVTEINLSENRLAAIAPEIETLQRFSQIHRAVVSTGSGKAGVGFKLARGDSAGDRRRHCPDRPAAGEKQADFAPRHHRQPLAALHPRHLRKPARSPTTGHPGVHEVGDLLGERQLPDRNPGLGCGAAVLADPLVARQPDHRGPTRGGVFVPSRGPPRRQQPHLVSAAEHLRGRVARGAAVPGAVVGVADDAPRGPDQGADEAILLPRLPRDPALAYPGPQPQQPRNPPPRRLAAHRLDVPGHCAQRSRVAPRHPLRAPRPRHAHRRPQRVGGSASFSREVRGAHGALRHPQPAHNPAAIAREPLGAPPALAGRQPVRVAAGDLRAEAVVAVAAQVPAGDARGARERRGAAAAVDAPVRHSLGHLQPLVRHAADAQLQRPPRRARLDPGAFAARDPRPRQQQAHAPPPVRLRAPRALFARPRRQPHLRHPAPDQPALHPALALARAQLAPPTPCQAARSAAVRFQHAVSSSDIVCVGSRALRATDALSRRQPTRGTLARAAAPDQSARAVPARLRHSRHSQRRHSAPSLATAQPVRQRAGSLAEPQRPDPDCAAAPVQQQDAAAPALGPHAHRPRGALSRQFPSISALRLAFLISFAGNQIQRLPPEFSRLTKLSTLHIDGESFDSVPAEVVAAGGGK
eukprot:1878464-Rhodomonas_salina.5